MARLVQKFGGTSVADVQKIKKAAQITVAAASEGHEVTTVISAMGHTTDHLIDLAEQIWQDPHAKSAREMDMLMATGEQVSIALFTMALQALGVSARSFTGAQAGIITENRHGTARIQEVFPDKLEATLSRGEIAVVAGFQGVTESHELTTLGRGGSDTTAVALAAALGADRCDIYTDVDGVFTADPRIISQARCLSTISYEEMLELAATGAQVMNARSVELAMDNHVPIRVRSTFTPENPGTLITHRVASPEYTIAGIALDMNSAQIKLKSLSQIDAAQPLEGVAALFTRLNELGIQTDMVMAMKREDEPSSELIFTLEKSSLPRVQKLVEALATSLGNPLMQVESDIAKVSVVGRRLTSRPEVVASVFECLHEAKIPVQMVATGDMRVSILMPARYGRDAVKLIHAKFNLEEGTINV
ncbi:MAG: aspartate kinase [Candidatus Obscuribacter sp.]|jgi:aspartate kinase|nr:aspartate kinase [Candidatus Obscuribacter sp.]MBK9617788.1 aspartate kinase [Candidatus Obscuribacter sp.]MBL0187319.1 aspartate kinase [Candidatus Obscuribacter sp.]MDQ5965675.1 Aspartokinase [Cyanobacteriota bacterium erpe_2018_sw_39hr_WHONDRS-SW48-000098_B_bin.30]